MSNVEPVADEGAQEIGPLRKNPVFWIFVVLLLVVFPVTLFGTYWLAEVPSWRAVGCDPIYISIVEARCNR